MSDPGSRFVMDNDEVKVGERNIPFQRELGAAAIIQSQVFLDSSLLMNARRLSSEEKAPAGFRLRLRMREGMARETLMRRRTLCHAAGGRVSMTRGNFCEESWAARISEVIYDW